MGHVRTSGLAAAAILAAGIGLGPAEAAPYVFVNIADSTGPLAFDPEDASRASINAGGTVTFAATLDGGGQSVFTGNGGALTTIATTGPVFTGFAPPFGPGINDAGTVAFFATTARGAGVFSSNGGAATTIAATGATFTAFSAPVSIDSAGTVAFQGLLVGGGSRIATGSGGAATIYASVAGIGENLGPPKLADDGTARFTGVIGGVNAIFTGDGVGAPTPIYATSGAFASFIPPVTANQAGIVAFVGSTDGGQVGVFRGDGGPADVIADGDDFISFSANVAINATGVVAFSASTATVSGIFLGPDVDTDAVIRIGDPLFGSTVSQLGFYRDGLNDAGQLAFFYRLDDGRIGVARADPAESVPAPPSALLLAVGLFATGIAGALRRP